MRSSVRRTAFVSVINLTISHNPYLHLSLSLNDNNHHHNEPLAPSSLFLLPFRGLYLRISRELELTTRSHSGTSSSWCGRSFSSSLHDNRDCHTFKWNLRVNLASPRQLRPPPSTGELLWYSVVNSSFETSRRCRSRSDSLARCACSSPSSSTRASWPPPRPRATSLYAPRKRNASDPPLHNSCNSTSVSNCCWPPTLITTRHVN